MIWDRRTAMMALVSVIIGKATQPPTLTREGLVPGILTVNLDLFSRIVVKCKGKSIEILPSQIYDELVKP
jgi:hypothetical protein